MVEKFRTKEEWSGGNSETRVRDEALECVGMDILCVTHHSEMHAFHASSIMPQTTFDLSSWHGLQTWQLVNNFPALIFIGGG